jgi:hypothetical protein
LKREPIKEEDLPKLLGRMKLEWTFKKIYVHSR